jgi:hypothetical protein
MMKGTKLTGNYVLRRPITTNYVQFITNIAFRYSNISQVVCEQYSSHKISYLLPHSRHSIRTSDPIISV